MKITSIFGLCIAASLCFLSCTDGDEIQQNITPNVDTMPVKLALGMAPMHDTGGVTRARGDNSLTWCWARKRIKLRIMPGRIPQQMPGRR